MGLYIFSYGIKVNEIKSVFGSKDLRLVEKISQNEIFQMYCEPEVGFTATTPKALSDLINGNALNDKLNYEYGYALVAICATLGSELPYSQEIKLGYETDLINDTLSEDFRIEDFVIEDALLNDSSDIFPIPIITDFPVIGFLPFEDLVELKDILQGIEISDETVAELHDSSEEDDEDKACAYEHIKGIIDNLKFCIKNNLDLISFCH